MPEVVSKSMQIFHEAEKAEPEVAKIAAKAIEITRKKQRAPKLNTEAELTKLIKEIMQ